MPIATVPPELEIPAIDLSPDSPQTDEERAATLLKALNTVGFLFVLNPHADLDVAHVRDIFSAGEELFSVPLKDKEAVQMDLASGAGYTSMMGQTTGDRSERVRGDIKESFSIGSDTLASIPSASAALAPRLNAFRQACFACGTRLLDLFTIALGYPEGDDRYFSRRHTYGHNESLRLLNYPAFPRAKADEVDKQGGQTRWDELKIGEKDLRAGAHQDFGSATLLFQSPPEVDGTDTAVDGLEIFVRRPDGNAIAPDGSGDKGWWLPAPKPKGTGGGGSILVNVGVSMDIWSGGQFKATWHRVVCPPGDMVKGRRSTVFFMIPDNEVRLTPLTGNVPAKAEGCMTSGEYFKLRMNRSYGATQAAV